ncbi:MAG: phosphoesterase [Planctomycetota bacterium]|nr:phosphoesterase [Planctomycetota bacterium]RLT10517.1 MAG: phosphoesterase [Planctomycetota bacterium]
MASKDDERVLCVPTSEVDALGHFQGFERDADRYLAYLLKTGIAKFVRRGDCETDPSLKQIIPYVVFWSGDRVFNYTRGSSQGESRLHALKSIGVGGHVAEEDAAGGCTAEAYEMALKRELDEEVRIDVPGRMLLAGLINDDSSPVGQVHLGVVHLYHLDAPAVHPLEDGLAAAGFIKLAQARDSIHEFETWSQIVLANLLKQDNEPPLA